MVGMAARPQHLGTVVLDTGVAVAVVVAVGSITRHSTTNHRSTHRRSPRRPTMSIRVTGAAVVVHTVVTTDIVAMEAVAVEAVQQAAAAGHHMGTTTSINTASRRKHGETRNNRASHSIVRGVTNNVCILFVKTARLHCAPSLVHCYHNC